MKIKEFFCPLVKDELQTLDCVLSFDFPFIELSIQQNSLQQLAAIITNSCSTNNMHNYVRFSFHL